MFRISKNLCTISTKFVQSQQQQAVKFQPYLYYNNKLNLSSNSSIQYKPVYRFCQEKKTEEGKQQQQEQKQEEQKEELNSEQINAQSAQRMESFFKYLNDQIDQPDEALNLSEKQFTDYTLYNNTADMKSRVNMNLAYAGFWFGVSSLVFMYAPQYNYIATIIPAWFFAGNMVQFQIGRSYTSKLGKQLTLKETMDAITIQFANGSSSDFLIENVNLIDIIELNNHGGKSVKGSDEAPQLSEENHFIAVFDAEDTKGKEHKDLRILITDNIINFQNLSLLKFVLQGDVKKVQEYEKVSTETFVDSQRDAEEKKDKELEDELEAEIEAIKKQKQKAQEEQESLKQQK